MRLICAFKAFFQALKKTQEEVPAKSCDSAHLRLLALLQKEGRLIDFLKEDIAAYSDAQVGAAVRSIHAKCRDSIEEFVTLRPLFTEEEGAIVTVPKGYDPSVIKIIGRVNGEPPYKGILRHRGWKAHKESLPKKSMHAERSIVSPAEIEVQ